MERKWNEATIMTSWRCCAQSGLQPSSTEKCYPFPGFDIQQLQANHRVVIEAFKSATSDCPLPQSTIFLLVDQCGTLLEKAPAGVLAQKIPHGFSFATEHAGTNAIALALALEEPVWTLREQNYLSILSRFSLYCVPCLGILPKYYIALLTAAKQSPEWPIALLQQLVLQMTADVSNSPQSSPSSILLSKRQHEVLLCMAHGMKDMETAAHLHISLDTVRYHKKNIYQLLDTDNRVSAVVLALKQKIIEISQVNG